MKKANCSSLCIHLTGSAHDNLVDWAAANNPSSSLTDGERAAVLTRPRVVLAGGVRGNEVGFDPILPTPSLWASAPMYSMFLTN